MLHQLLFIKVNIWIEIKHGTFQSIRISESYEQLKETKCKREAGTQPWLLWDLPQLTTIL